MTDAFCTLRILPRMGRSAWKSDWRASLAVPSALSPSTMKSSDFSMSWVRQSASFGGQGRRLERVLAARDLLLLAGGHAGPHLGDDLLEHGVRLGLVVALGRVEDRGELGLDDLGDDGPHRRRAEDLLGLALELRLREPDGHHGGQSRHDVVLLDAFNAVLGHDLEPAGVRLDDLAESLHRGPVRIRRGACRPSAWR